MSTTAHPPSRARKRRSKSSLAIIERAFRGSLEEQYGHIVWLSRVMHGMGAATALLLKGDTVMCARAGQPRVSLTVGDLHIAGISHYESTISDLLREGVPLYAWQADWLRLHLANAELIAGVALVGDADLPSLIQQFDCVWYW
ncbi:DsrE family protein [Paraburkholderia dilworthii]|uniref:DsrE family protein n=1 Tax=Paraburkholderia dilworthii TaxID=948106 RepID=UPI0003FBD0FC|nr:DsrE family protein [Paraburkholderia dilworthii]